MKADWKGKKKKSVTDSYHKERGIWLSLPGKWWELGALFDLRKKLLECTDLKMFKMDFSYGNTCRISLPDLVHFMLNKILISGDFRRKLIYVPVTPVFFKPLLDIPIDSRTPTPHCYLICKKVHQFDY